jgi:hypothetical protein
MITDNTLIYLFYFAVVFLISRIPPAPQAARTTGSAWPSFGRRAF